MTQPSNFENNFENNFELEKFLMLKYQIEARGIKNSRVISAMQEIPRHLFVLDAFIEQAYGDFPLPIGESQTISQPYIVAEMTQALNISQTDKILEIGTGSGYQAAILSKLASQVFTIERIESLFKKAQNIFKSLNYQNIFTKLGDGTIGWEEESPFDAIIITAGSPSIPQILIDQLKINGRMIIPVGDQNSQSLIKIHKTEAGLEQINLGGCRFVKLIGQYGW